MDVLYRGLFTAAAIIVPMITWLVWEVIKEEKHKEETKKRVYEYARKINGAYTEEKARLLFKEIFNDENDNHKAYSEDISRLLLILSTRIDLYDYLKDNPL